MSDAKYIPSTTPGKHWRLHVSSSRGTVFGYATEGDLVRHDNGIESFSYTMFEARSEKAWTDAKRMTAKAVAGALVAVEEQLRMKGYIA